MRSAGPPRRSSASTPLIPKSRTTPRMARRTLPTLGPPESPATLSAFCSSGRMSGEFISAVMSLRKLAFGLGLPAPLLPKAVAFMQALYRAFIETALLGQRGADRVALGRGGLFRGPRREPRRREGGGRATRPRALPCLLRTPAPRSCWASQTTRITLVRSRSCRARCAAWLKRTSIIKPGRSNSDKNPRWNSA